MALTKNHQDIETDTMTAGTLQFLHVSARYLGIENSLMHSLPNYRMKKHAKQTGIIQAKKTYPQSNQLANSQD